LSINPAISRGSIIFGTFSISFLIFSGMGFHEANGYINELQGCVKIDGIPISAVLPPLVPTGFNFILDCVPAPGSDFEYEQLFDNLYILPGAKLTINPGVVANINLQMTIQEDLTGLLPDGDGTLENFGTYKNSGATTNDGLIINRPGATFRNFALLNGGTFENHGTFTNDGADSIITDVLAFILEDIFGLEINLDGYIANQGEFNSHPTSNFLNSGAILNSVSDPCALLSTPAEFQFHKLYSTGDIVNGPCQVVKISGDSFLFASFTNSPGAQVEIDGYLLNGGTIVNTPGVFVPIGGTELNLASTVTIKPGATLQNSDFFWNQGFGVPLIGIVENNGALLNINNGIFSNDGRVDNNSGNIQNDCDSIFSTGVIVGPPVDYNCAKWIGGSGFWSNPSNWSTTPPFGGKPDFKSPVFIDNGATVTLNENFVAGEPIFLGTFPSLGSQLIVNPGFELTMQNNANIFVQGAGMINNGKIVLESCSPTCTIAAVNSGSPFTNKGIIENLGGKIVHDEQPFQNAGTVINSAFIENIGEFNNQGGAFLINTGTFGTDNSINSGGTLTNSGTVDNQARGKIKVQQINNAGTFFNSCQGIITVVNPINGAQPIQDCRFFVNVGGTGAFELGDSWTPEPCGGTGEPACIPPAGTDELIMDPSDRNGLLAFNVPNLSSDFTITSGSLTVENPKKFGEVTGGPTTKKAQFNEFTMVFPGTLTIDDGAIMDNKGVSNFEDGLLSINPGGVLKVAGKITSSNFHITNNGLIEFECDGQITGTRAGNGLETTTNPLCLVSHWNGDVTADNVGSFADVADIESAHNGERLGGVTFDPAGKVGPGFSFPGGVGDYIKIEEHADFRILNDILDPDHGTPLPADGLTLAAWVNPDGVPVDQFDGIITLWSNNHSFRAWGLWLWNQGGQLRANAAVEFTGGITDVTGGVGGPTGTIPIGQWTHLAMTLDNPIEQMRLYVNGEQVGVPISAPGIMHNPAFQNLRIGGDGTPSPREFDGKIDEVVVHRRALNADEIFDLFADCAHPAPSSTWFIDSTCKPATSLLRSGNTVVQNGGYLIIDDFNEFTLDSSTLTIEPGGRVDINPNAIITNKGGQIINNGIFNSFGGNLNIASTFTNNHYFENQGGIINNDGTINENSPGGQRFLNNGGTINNNVGAIINVNHQLSQAGGSAQLNNDGTININSFGTLHNEPTTLTENVLANNPGGIINIQGSGNLNNDGQNTFINNFGFINNGGIVNNAAGGVVENRHFFKNQVGSAIHNSGILREKSPDGQSFINQAVINNNEGGSLIVDHFLLQDSGATINNWGHITNNGILRNQAGSNTIINHETGTILNNPGGVLDNNEQDSINNGGLIYNAGNFNNRGLVQHGGTIINLDKIKNFRSAAETGTLNLFGGILENSEGGVIHNSGSIFSAKASTINNKKGSFFRQNDLLSHGPTGSLLNFGRIDNGGTFNNIGDLSFGTDATLINTGSFINKKPFSMGTEVRLTSTGLVKNNDQITNFGKMVIMPSGTLQIKNPGSLLIKSTATLKVMRDPISLWSAEGNANDSIDGNHGTLNNGATFGRGIASQGFDLDGIDDYVNRDTVSLPTGDVATVTAWVYPESYPDSTYNGIVSWGDRTLHDSFVLSVQNNGRPSFANWFNDFVPGSGPALNLNQWNFVAAVLDGTSITLYVNGVPVSGTLPAPPNIVSKNLSIGTTDYPGRHFNGLIDEVAIYDIALSESKIQALYDALKFIPEIVFSENFDGVISGWTLSPSPPTDITTNPGVTGTTCAGTSPTHAGVSAPSSPNWGFVQATVVSGNGPVNVVCEKSFTVVNPGVHGVSSVLGTAPCGGCVITTSLYIDGVQIFSQTDTGTRVHQKSSVTSLTAGEHKIQIEMHTTTAFGGDFTVSFDDILITKEN